MNAVQEQNQAVRTEPKAEREYMAPEVNIFETNEGYVLEADMPGVNKEGLEVSVEGNQLTIIGRRPDQGQAPDLLYRESAPADYRRAFELDPSIDTRKISAKIENGVLTIELPKAEKVKPRKIAVQ